MSNQHINSTGRKQDKLAAPEEKNGEADARQPRKIRTPIPPIPPDEESTLLADMPASAGKSSKLCWLWENRLEWGSVAIIQGNKGAGKSTWCRAIAADVTGGPALPGKAKGKRVLGNVLWYAGEEPLWSRVRPGLEAAKADLRRCFLADSLGDMGATLALPNDCSRLAERIVAREARLVVIDPLFAFTDGSCDLEGPTVPARRFMREIMRVASATGCLILLSRNNTKSTGNGALAAGRGSGELGNAARSVLHLAPLPDDPLAYALSVAACNTGAPVPALTYRLVGSQAASVIQVTGQTDLTADELADGDEGSLDRNELETAKALIRSMLPSGKLDSKVVKSKAEAAMIGTRTLQRAAKSLGVKMRREGAREATVSFWVAPVGGYK
jgi:AAA domain